MIKLKTLEMRFRVAMPPVVRRVYRSLRSLQNVQQSRPLTPELFDGGRLCASRLHMLDHLPHGGRVLELGTLRGDFARAILSRCQPSELHLVDINYSFFDPRDLPAPRVTCHQGLTHEITATFDDGYFDWVYIDADHSYEGALRDAQVAAPKVRSGGYLVFNDFAHIDPHLGRYGVHRAVVDFALDAKWPFRLFAYNPEGLYDVALQRP